MTITHENINESHNRQMKPDPKMYVHMIPFINTENQAKHTDGDRCQEDDYHRGGRGAWGSLGDSGNALHLDFGEGEQIFSTCKNSENCTHIYIHFYVYCKKKFLKHLSENKMI